MADGDAIRPRHWELEVHGDTLQNQTGGLVCEHLVPLGFVRRVEVFSQIPRPVCASGLGVSHIHDIIDVAHAILLTPDNGLAVEACMVGIRQVAFCSDGEGAPVRREGREDAGGFGEELFWEAEGETFANTGFRVREQAGVWTGLGKRPGSGGGGGGGLLTKLYRVPFEDRCCQATATLPHKCCTHSMACGRREKKVTVLLRDSNVVREARPQPRKLGNDRGRVPISIHHLPAKQQHLLQHTCPCYLNEVAL
jgi:hypothetical protein